jgi:malate synthase
MNDVSDIVTKAGLQVDGALARFVDIEVLGPLGQAPDAFWQGFADLLAEYAPRNWALLAKRDELQARIDRWHVERRGQPHDPQAYRGFLE